MPKGPNGVPRLTDIGPFVRDLNDAEIDDIWIDSERKTYGRIKSEFLEYGSLSDDFHNIQAEDGGEVVTVKLKYNEWDTILGDSDFFTYTAGKISYSVSDVGYIHKIWVSEDFRQLGIGAELMEIALDDMRNNGVDKVYTKAISDEGDIITNKFGFEEHEELNSLNPRDEWKVKGLA